MHSSNYKNNLNSSLNFQGFFHYNFFTMADRGMKKRLPFASLVEQQEYLNKMLYEKNKIARPLVSIERARKIDTILKLYPNTTLNFELYIDGYLYTYVGKILKIDKNKKLVYFDEFFLPIRDIIDIENPNPFADIC